MGKESIKAAFIRDVFGGDRQAYLRARETDYCAAQLEWDYYTDSLCRNGIISEKQRRKLTF